MALRDMLVSFGLEVVGLEKMLQAESAMKRLAKQAQATGRALSMSAGRGISSFRGINIGGAAGAAGGKGAGAAGGYNAFGNSISRIAKYLLVGAAIRGIRDFTKGQLEAADALKHNAERLGVTTDELQKYEYAAKLAGVPVQQMVVGLRYFNRTVGEALLGTKAANKTFEQLGVKIHDAHGNIKPTNDLLFESADKLKGVDSQAKRVAFSMRLFGKSGAAMLPAFQQGGAALRKEMREVDEMGGGFNDAFIEQAHLTDNMLKKLNMGWRSIYVAIMTEILPIFQKYLQHSMKVIKHLIDLAKYTHSFRTALQVLSVTIGAIAAIKVATMFSGWGVAIMAAGAALYGLWEVWDDFYTFMVGGRSIIGDQLNKIGGDGNEDRVRENLKRVFKPFEEALGPIQDIFTKMNLAFIEMIPSIVKWGGVFTTYVIELLDTAGVKAEQFLNKIHGSKLLGNILTGAAAGGAVGSVVPGLGTITGALVGGATMGVGSLLQDYMTPNAANDKEQRDLEQRRRERQQVALGFADLTAPVSHAPPAINVTVNQTINGASDPKASADAGQKGVRAGLKDAANQQRDTFAAVRAGQPATGN